MDSIRNAGKNIKEGAYSMVGVVREEAPQEPLSTQDSMRQSLREMGDETNKMIEEICPALSYKQRVIGFVVCAGVGYLLSFGSFLRLAQVHADHNICH